MALALTPVVIAVSEAATRHSRETLAGRLWPGLAAIAGLLLLLIQPSLSNPAVDLVLVLTPLLTGCGAVLFCSAHEQPSGGFQQRCLAPVLRSVSEPQSTSPRTSVDCRTWPASLRASTRSRLCSHSSHLAGCRPRAGPHSSPSSRLLILLEGIVMVPSSIPARMIVGPRPARLRRSRSAHPTFGRVALRPSCIATRPRALGLRRHTQRLTVN